MLRNAGSRLLLSPSFKCFLQEAASQPGSATYFSSGLEASSKCVKESVLARLFLRELRCLSTAPAAGQAAKARTKGGWVKYLRGMSTAAATPVGAGLQEAAASLGVGGITAGLSSKARQQLSWWLGGCSAWVFSMVVLGGVTRLTRSGLSMTDWKFTGERPPSSQAEWEAEFLKYQQSPEFKRVHSRMTLAEFKYIYWMEWAHRMWGRALGVVFVVPGSYFLYRGWVPRALGGRLGLLFLLGGSQGLVGWWMVRSGLQEPAHENAVPRVSPYRLASHLTAAFTIYSLLIWTTLSVANPIPYLAKATAEQIQGARLLRSRLLPLSCLVAVTAVSGAFVAGLDAGRAYNDFPWMNGRLIPEEYFAIAGWRNAFENTAAVQLHHRALALSTLAGVTALWASCRGLPLPGPTKTLLHATLAATGAQVALGITTLMTYVPASLGSLHQSGAMVLFTLVLALLHATRPVAASQTAALVSRLAIPVSAAGALGIGLAVTYNN